MTCQTHTSLPVLVNTPQQKSTNKEREYFLLPAVERDKELRETGMSEVRDPTIKLFGKTIQLLPEEDVSGTLTTTTTTTTTTKVSAHHQPNSSTTTTSQDNEDPIQSNQKPSGGESTGTKEEVELISVGPRTLSVDKETIAEELIGPATSSGISEDSKTPSVDKETLSPKTTNKEDPSDTSISDEKTFKKPDKILSCPRCNNMDTKFCYYNNYNVNQPRHFCKNCQRYWTAGGTIRNVPVGSGRRKNKSSPASNYCHIMVSEALQAARADAANGIHHPNGSSVLTFGSDSPLCESMASALILAENSQNCVRNRFQGHEQRIPVSYGGTENGDDHSSGSSSSVSNPAEKEVNGGQESVLKKIPGSPPQVPCFPVPPLPSPRNSTQWRSPLPLPAFDPSGFPISFYPTPHYWGCTISSPWNLPWLSPQPTSSDHSALGSSPNSPTLGKHSRDGNMLRPSNPGKEELLEEKYLERGVLIPKTLRINDPNEAAKSSIWSTLGINNENTDSISGPSLLKAFRPKGIEKNHMTETSPVLQANPAALSRSLNFQEST